MESSLRKLKDFIPPEQKMVNFGFEREKCRHCVSLVTKQEGIGSDSS
jgi:hypothetical protein